MFLEIFFLKKLIKTIIQSFIIHRLIKKPGEVVISKIQRLMKYEPCVFRISKKKLGLGF